MESKFYVESVEKLERDISGFLVSDVCSTYFLSGLIAQIPALVSVVDSRGKVIFVSPHHLLLSGVADELGSLVHIDDLFPKSICERFSLSLHEAVLARRLKRWVLVVHHKDGRTFRYDMIHSIYFDEKTQQSNILTLGVDVSYLRLSRDSGLTKHKAQSNDLDFYDPLTGLLDRALFYDRVGKSLSGAKRKASNFTFMLLNLDRFQNINDNLGMYAGDNFLKVTAQRLVNVLRDTDMVARLNADEFVVVLDGVYREEDIVTVFTKLLSEVAMPVNIQGHELSCTASIGISLFPHDGDNVEQLLRYADLAMSYAKRNGKNRAQFCADLMTDDTVNYLSSDRGSRKAAEAEPLAFYSQPHIDLSGKKIQRRRYVSALAT